MSEPSASDVEICPGVVGERLLDLVLEAQASTAHFLSGSKIKTSAEALVQYAVAAGSPMLMAASPMAQRLVGAALLLSNGALRAADAGSAPTGQDVLLVEAVAARDVGLGSQRDQLIALGVRSVQLVALGILARDDSQIPILLDFAA